MRTWSVFFACVAGSLVCSCAPAVFENPLPPSDAGPQVAVLRGTWVAMRATRTDERGTLTIIPGDKESELEIVYVDPAMDPRSNSLKGTATVVAGCTYLSLRLQLSYDTRTEKAEFLDGYMIFKCVLDDDGTLKMWWFDDDKVERRIKDGRLTGAATRMAGDDEVMLVKNSSAELAALIREAKHDELFAEFGTFRRAATPGRTVEVRLATYEGRMAGSAILGKGALQERRVWTRLARPIDLLVFVTNNSEDPIDLYEQWNSWGYYAIGFVLRTPDGTQHRITKKARAWTKNFPSMIRLAPGRCHVIPVAFTDDVWKGLDAIQEDAELQVVFHQTRTIDELMKREPWAERYKNKRIFMGEIKSPFYRVNEILDRGSALRGEQPRRAP